MVSLDGPWVRVEEPAIVLWLFGFVEYRMFVLFGFPTDGQMFWQTCTSFGKRLNDTLSLAAWWKTRWKVDSNFCGVLVDWI